MKQEKPERIRKRRKWIIPFVLMIGFAAVWGWWNWGGRDGEERLRPGIPVAEQPEIVPIEHDLPGPYEGVPRREASEFAPVEVLREIPPNPSDQAIAGSRLFGLRLMATDETGAEENRVVGKLLRELRGLDAEVSRTIDRESDPHGFERAYRREKFARVASWLASNGDSPWAAALRHELAGYRYDRGYLDEAREVWRDHWEQFKEAPEGTSAHRLANEALGRLFDLSRGLARADELRTLVAESEGRYLGAALEGKLFLASEGLWLLDHTGAPHVMCGPLALNSICEHLGKAVNPPLLKKITPDYMKVGLPLTEVAGYAEGNYGLPARMAKREEASAVIPSPSVVHVTDEHYLAVLESSETGDEYFIEDRTLRFAGWVDREALESRASGYVLLASNEALPAGWRAVEQSEGREVFGRDGAHGTEECLTRCCSQNNSGCGGEGMPSYSIHLLPAALRIWDTPLRYQPPVGYGVGFTVNFNDLDQSAPITSPAFSHVGVGWSIDWVAWVDHEPGAISANTVVGVHVPGGGLERHRFDANTQPVREPTSGSVVTRTGAHTYTRTFSDGSKEVYNTPDDPVSPARVFLTEMIDPSGNALSFGYDAQMRLITVTDAIGQVTTLQYDDPADIFRITSVTDPFNRTALLGYNPDGELASVTDQIGLTSTFTYEADGFVDEMTTPYGTTDFDKEGYFSSTLGSNRSVQVTDPQGDVEKVKYVDLSGGPNIPSINLPPASVTVAGVAVPFESAGDTGMNFRNTIVWSKEAWHAAPDDASAAVIHHWYTDSDWRVVPVLQALKQPLEDRVWFNYPGSDANEIDRSQGIQPTKVLRMLADGTPQLYQYEYNGRGNRTKAIDPLGRTTQFTWSSDGLDLLAIKNITGGINETLVSIGYNAAHQPTSITDAAGQTWSVGYNARGQVESVSNPLGETTTTTYDADGYLLSVDRPLPGNADLSNYGYDALGRPASVTPSGGQTTTVTYDAFDRVTRVDYPAGTFTANTYDRLSLKTVTDRLGRTTTYNHNALGQVTSVTNPLGRTTLLEWCRCGDIRKLTDTMGRVTQWQYDVQHRPFKKTYPDSSEENWSYDSSMGYLAAVTRRNGQSIIYDYTLDGRLASVNYPPVAGIPAPAGVSYVYEAVHGRQTSMTDGIGTTNFTYHAAGGLGAGRLAAVDGPWANDTVTYTYDALGRVEGHQIAGVSFGTNRSYDPLGRLNSITNVLGTFGFTHDTGSHLGLTSVAYPNGMQIDYDYLGATEGYRLASIHNRLPGGGTSSRFDYGYDAAGQITSWTRELLSGASTYSFGYDAAGQLISAVLTQAGQPVAPRGFSYDPAGNRMSSGSANDESTALFNNLNQMTQLTPEPSSQWTLVAGQLDEPAEVKVDGQPVPITSDNRFERNMNLMPGTHQVPIEATDRDGNTSSKTYEVTVAAPVPLPLQYDSAGNLIRQEMADGIARLFEWDGLGRLLAIQSDETPAAGDWRTEFTYDGMGRRVKREEFTHNGSGWSTDEAATYLWCGPRLCQKRSSNGSAASEHYLAQGFTRNGYKYYTTRDHIGSVREVVSESGQLYAAFDYDPWGQVERLYGSPVFEVPFRYTGHFYHERSELHLTLFRAYDPAAGRWLSPDPIGENGGINLYGYAINNPIVHRDRLGLDIREYKTDNDESECLSHWEVIIETNEGLFRASAEPDLGLVISRVPGNGTFEAYEGTDSSANMVGEIDASHDEGSKVVEQLRENFEREKYNFKHGINDCGETIDKVKTLLDKVRDPEYRDAPLQSYLDHLNDIGLTNSFGIGP